MTDEAVKQAHVAHNEMAVICNMRNKVSSTANSIQSVCVHIRGTLRHDTAVESSWTTV